MIFIKTKLEGAVIIEPERLEDERGFFARSFYRKEFEDHGLNPNVIQCGISFNQKKGTLRGMHYQSPPYPEVKLVRCTMGAIWDVILDLRPESPSFKQWLGVELTAENRKMLYVPKGFAHGFQTLVSNAEVFYQIAEWYLEASSKGYRYDDPAFDIRWPLSVECIGKKDLAWESFQGGYREGF